MAYHDDPDEDSGPMYVVNHEAMYWRSRALRAERERDDLKQRYFDSVDTACRLAHTSSQNLLHAIIAGAFDRKDPSNV